MKKILLISLSIFLLILVGGGIWAYQYFLAPDPEVTKQLEEEFSKEFFDFSDLNIDEEPSEASPVAGRETKDLHQGQNPSTTPQVENPSTTPQVENPTQNHSNSHARQPEKITEEVLVEKYTPKFKNLEAAAVERLDILFSSAYKEYKQGGSSEQKSSTSELAKKYMQAANLLEDGVDTKFQELLAKLEGELKQHNLSLEPIKKAEEEYNQAIKEKKSELLGKLK